MEFENLGDVYKLLIKEDLELVRTFQELGLIKRNYRCKRRNCRRPCSLRKKSKSNSLNAVFSCKHCKVDYSIFLGSFFEKISIPIKQVFTLMWLWACETRSGCAAAILGIRKATVVQIYRYFRDIISWKLLQNPDIFRLGKTIFVKKSLS